ncbi:hypothetical protein VTL71DRAFT_11341 [Oculimacula yallundae]|uniref:Uncharacterized protein n=1 Tax=Oculimacula yallundae TaxID=86028 RepID=A0ABR4CQH9_9HELO
MQLLFPVLAVLVTGVTSQAPKKCNADNCLRAIIASGQSPFPASASKDCMSAFVETVTVTPAAVTRTFSSTNTAPLVTVTNTVSTVTQTFIQTASSSTSTTLTQVFSTTDITIVPVTVTEISTPVVTRTDTVTTIVATQTQACPNARRFLPIARNAMRVDGRDSEDTIILWRKKDNTLETITGHALAARATVASVPRYASACSGIARYSSACSCIGITSRTTYITASPSTVSTTLFATTTPTSVTLQTSTSVSLVTVTTTIVIQATTSTTATETSTILISTTITETSPDTSTAVEPNTVTLLVTATTSASNCVQTCALEPNTRTGTYCRDNSLCYYTEKSCTIQPDSSACFKLCTGSCAAAGFMPSRNRCVIYGPCCQGI